MSPWAPTPPDLAVAALAAVALYTDLRTRRIPNLLTFGGMGLGLAMQAAHGQPLIGLLGIVAAFALMFPGWAFFGAIRAGDAKILMAAGAFWGPGDAARACVLAYLLNLPFGLAVLAWKGRLRNVGAAWRFAFRRVRGAEGRPPEQLTMAPFMVVIALALLLARATDLLRW